ncbi:MAG: hypothetical protein V3S39_00995 [Thermodesulfobacteriota bacterium]
MRLYALTVTLAVAILLVIPPPSLFHHSNSANARSCPYMAICQMAVGTPVALLISFSSPYETLEPIAGLSVYLRSAVHPFWGRAPPIADPAGISSK